jgi:hypothetical protein
MDEINESPRSVLIAAVFCAIIGLIAYAGYMTDPCQTAVNAAAGVRGLSWSGPPQSQRGGECSSSED